MTYQEIANILQEEAHHLLEFDTPVISKDLLKTPSPHLVDEVFSNSNRSPRVVANLKRLYNHGRLGGSGYLSILPVDQGIEHTAMFSFYKNPIYFNPEAIIQLALQADCSGVASTFGALALMSDKYADDIPFIVKLNHNELLTYPNKHDQILFSQVKQAADMGAAGVGATIYFGAEESNRQIQEISRSFAEAHQRGLFTILWCYPRNEAFRKGEENLETAADISSQACHLGVTIGADIIKQKLPATNYGFQKVDFAKYNQPMYQALSSEHPIDMARLQVLHCYNGQIGLLNSGGGSTGENDLREVIRTAVINKRAGGVGLIAGRKAFQRPFNEGVELLQSIQDVYLSEEITVA